MSTPRTSRAASGGGLASPGFSSPVAVYKADTDDGLASPGPPSATSAAASAESEHAPLHEVKSLGEFVTFKRCRRLGSHG